MNQLTDQHPPTPTPNLPTWFPALVLGILWLAVIAPGLLMGFHADDWFQIRPRTFGDVLGTFFGDWNSGHRGEGGFFRPLVRLSFFIDQIVFGLRPWGYHLTNGLIFGALVAGVFRCGQVLCPGRQGALAFILAIGLLLNPLKNEALYWISGRTDLLASLFVIWSLYFALRAVRDEGEEHRQYPAIKSTIISLVFLLAGLLSKEVALSACLIIPLITILLSTSTAITIIKKLLVAGPVSLGIIYFLYRSIILGGLAGYTSSEPHTMVELGNNLYTMTSALWWPWQSGTLDIYAPSLGIMTLIILTLILFWTRLRRDLLALTLTMFIALGPMILIRISPFDGDRVLVLGLCFQVLLLCCFFLPPKRKHLITQSLLAFVAVLYGGLLQISNMSIIREFLEAKSDSEQVVQQVWEAVEMAPDGSMVVLPPEFPARDRHYLNNGKMLVMAMETLWINELEGTSDHEFNYMIPKVTMNLESEKRTVSVAVTLQSWMKTPTLLYWNTSNSIKSLSLQKQKTIVFDETQERKQYIPAGKLLLVETTGSSPEQFTPTSNDQHLSPAIQLPDPSGPSQYQWWVTSPKEIDQPTIVTFPESTNRPLYVTYDSNAP